MNSTKELSDLIMEEYVVGMEMEETPEIISKLVLLQNNDLAYGISDIFDFYYDNYAKYPIACKMIQKYNKDIKKYRRKIEKNELGGDESNYADSKLDMKKVMKYALDVGTYIAMVEPENYMIIEASHHTNDNNNSDYGDIDFTVWFVGNKYRKYRDKYLKKCEKIEKLVDKDRKDYIEYPDGHTDTTFKSMDQLVMKNKADILKYIDNWVKNIPVFYDTYHIIPKLSIMIYGVPGTGKSTFSKALAKYLDINRIQLISKTNFMETDGRKSRSYRGRGTSYTPKVFTLDDIDCICKSRDDKDHDSNNDVILQSLLEFLDNPPKFYFKAKNGKKYPVSIVVATTNYYDKLDPAVKRFGRFDLTFEMSELDKDGAIEMCSLYDLNANDLIPNLNSKGFKISPSKLQAMCIDNIDKRLKSV